MPRRARLILPNVPLHLIQRRHDRHACFFAGEDYRCYLHWLDRHAARFGCTVHAYVLMTNHVHLVISALASGAPAAMMKAQNQRYVHNVNRTYRRTGTLSAETVITGVLHVHGAKRWTLPAVPPVKPAAGKR